MLIESQTFFSSFGAEGLKVWDGVFEILHLLVIGINLFGWIPRSTRTLQKWVLLFTSLSWLVLGSFYGLGYCFLTDWHWTVKHLLGVKGLPSSYIQYLFEMRLGLKTDPFWVDVLTGSVFVLLIVVTLIQMARERTAKQEK